MSDSAVPPTYTYICTRTHHMPVALEMMQLYCVSMPRGSVLVVQFNYWLSGQCTHTHLMPVAMEMMQLLACLVEVY